MRLQGFNVTSMIRHSRSNDRWELESETALDPQLLSRVNEEHRCIGYMSDDGDERRYLLVGPQDGFGTLHDHQDNFDDLLTRLKALAEHPLGTGQDLYATLRRVLEAEEEAHEDFSSWSMCRELN